MSTSWPANFRSSPKTSRGACMNSRYPIPTRRLSVSVGRAVCANRAEADARRALPEAPLLRRIIILAAALIALGGRRVTLLRLRLLLEEEKAGAVAVPAVVIGNKHVGRRSRLACDEAALRLVVQHRDELGAIVGLLAQRLVRDDDRGARLRGRSDAIEHVLRDGDAVERVPGVVSIVDRDLAPAQARIALRHRREDVRADR